MVGPPATVQHGVHKKVQVHWSPLLINTAHIFRCRSSCDCVWYDGYCRRLRTVERRSVTKWAIAKKTVWDKFKQFTIFSSILLDYRNVRKTLTVQSSSINWRYIAACLFIVKAEFTLPMSAVDDEDIIVIVTRHQNGAFCYIVFKSVRFCILLTANSVTDKLYNHIVG